MFRLNTGVNGILYNLLHKLLIGELVKLCANNSL